MGSLAMAKSEQSEVRPRRGKPADPRSDEDLILAIAGSRDRDAFLELFNRYQQAAFNLACHVAGGRVLGEEALQEAMVRLWTSARTFKPEGNARAWLLRIVAREALRSAKGQRRHARRAEVDLEGQPDLDREARGAGREAVDEELMAALHGQLEQLEPAQRSMLALYFSGGLSQREIAEALEVTQQTVSNRLNETLATLRKGLAQAGFAAAAPMLGADAIGAVLDSAYETPAGLADGLIAKLGRVADVSQRAAAAKSAGVLLWAAGVLAVAAAGGVAWWLAQPEDAVKVNEVKTGPASAAGANPESQPASAPVSDEPRVMTWDFSKGPVKDFAVLSGAWKWKETPKGGVMEVPEKVFVVLPFKPRTKPVHIEMDVEPYRTANLLTFGVYWIKEQPDRYLCLAREVHKQQTALRTLDVREHHYVFDRYVVNLVGGQVGYCSFYKEAYPGDYLVVSCGNSNLKRISLREIAMEEIPEAYRDPEKLSHQLTDEYKAYPEQVLLKQP